MAEETSVASAINFITKGQHATQGEKERLKAMVEIVYKHSSKHGLEAKQMKLLTHRIVTEFDTYGVSIRRRLLYSFISTKAESFPHEIIPCVLCTIYPIALEKPRGIGSWAITVLGWLSALLRYDVLDTENIRLRLCYVPCFYLLGNFKLARLCADIVYKLTRRIDVTPIRVKFLLKIKNKTGLTSPITKLLRLYSTMRPDLILVNDDGMVMPPKIVTNRLMAPGLDAFIRRHAAAHQDQEEYGDDLWSSAYKRQKVNFHLRDSAIPVPKVVQHSSTLEEKQSKRMNVMQCTRVRQLVSAIPSSDSWIWPNNPASMLRRPLLLLWFKPHSRRDTVMLESWLDVALSSEVLNENAASVCATRSHDLLRYVVLYAEQQLLCGRLCSPVIQQFLLTRLMLWDQQENLSLVLRLVQCLGCVESFTSVVLSRLLPLMATAPLPTACAVITCFTNTALNWCLTFKNNSEIMEDEGFAMVEGVLDLARQLDSCFLGSCLVHSLHPMLLYCILSFYHTINDCCEELSLPLVLCPSPPLTALMLSTTDVGIVHSLGILLSRLPAAYERIKTSTRENSRHAAFCAEVFKHTPQNNKCLQLYINCAHDSLVFVDSTEAWREMCTIFLGNKLVLAMLGARGLRYSGAMASQLQCAVLRSQAPPPVAGQAFAAESVEVRDYVLKALADMGLSGIQDFINSLKDPDSPTVELES